MKKLLLLLCLSTSTSVFSNIKNLSYASIYADRLIEQFDRELFSSIDGFTLGTTTYSKILASRIYIEKLTHDIPAYKVESFLFIDNVKSYNKVISDIEKMAIELLPMLKSNFKMNRENIIYPSAGNQGNINGSRFPSKVVSLTFDDGPRSGKTDKIVDSLNGFGMRASFFMLTREAIRYKRMTDYVLANDMELTLHSYNHKNLPKENTTTVKYEVLTAKKELEELTGKDIYFFRLPYGAGLRTNRIREVIKDGSMIHVFWNVDTLDWKDKNPKSIFDRAVKQLNKNRNQAGIVLFHDIHSQTVVASKMLMNYLYRNSFQVCTLSEIVGYLNGASRRVCL